MFDISLFLETPTFNLEDFDISDEILDAMLEVPYIDFETLPFLIFKSVENRSKNSINSINNIQILI